MSKDKTKDHEWVDVTTEGGFEITDQTPDLDHPTTLEIDSSDTVWGIALKTAADPDWKPRYHVHRIKGKRKNSRTYISISWIHLKGFANRLEDVKAEHVEPIMNLLRQAGYEYSDVPLREIKHSGL